MPLWITASGVGGIGFVYGYSLLYVLKRYLPPISMNPPSFKELILALVYFSVGGTIGAAFTLVDGVNMIGPYGIGFLLGMVANIVMTKAAQDSWYRRASKGPEPSTRSDHDSTKSKGT